LWPEKKVLIIETGSVLCEVRHVAEETVFIIETGSVFCEVRVEAEEAVEHRACSMVIVKRRV
jgi:hypothetical protein